MFNEMLNSLILPFLKYLGWQFPVKFNWTVLGLPSRRWEINTHKKTEFHPFYCLRGTKMLIFV